MRYLLLFLLLSSFTMLPTDREQINGTWSISEMKNIDGDLIFSTDKAVQEQLIEDFVTTTLETFEEDKIDEQAIRETYRRQIAEMEQMIFSFDEKGVAKVEVPDGEVFAVTESTFKMNEKNKVIVITTGDEMSAYNYRFDNEHTVTLTGENETLILVRRK